MQVKEDFADQRREDGVDTARTVRRTSSKAFMSLLTTALVAPTYERLADAFPSVRYYIYIKMKDLQLTDIICRTRLSSPRLMLTVSVGNSVLDSVSLVSPVCP